MKKKYEKPAMKVVEIRKRRLICNSPGGYNNQSYQLFRGGSDTLNDDDIDDII